MKAHRSCTMLSLWHAVTCIGIDGIHSQNRLNRNIIGFNKVRFGQYLINIMLHVNRISNSCYRLRILSLVLCLQQNEVKLTDISSLLFELDRWASHFHTILSIFRIFHVSFRYWKWQKCNFTHAQSLLLAIHKQFIFYMESLLLKPQHQCYIVPDNTHTTAHCLNSRKIHQFGYNMIIQQYCVFNINK